MVHSKVSFCITYMIKPVSNIQTCIHAINICILLDETIVGQKVLGLSGAVCADT